MRSFLPQRFSLNSTTDAARLRQLCSVVSWSLGAPQNTFGMNGETCVDAHTGDIYRKSNGAWVRTYDANTLPNGGAVGTQVLLADTQTAALTALGLDSTGNGLTIAAATMYANNFTASNGTIEFAYFADAQFVGTNSRFVTGAGLEFETGTNLVIGGNVTFSGTVVTMTTAAADAWRTAMKAVSSDPTGITNAAQVTNIVRMTQADYNNLVNPDPMVTYFIIPS